MERKGFIGGSDAVTIMSGQWYNLWEIKTGRKEPDDLSDNLAVQLGILSESLNLQWFEKEHDCVLASHQFEYKEQYPDINLTLKGTVDAHWDNGLEAPIVEAKHTNAFTNMDKVLAYYMPQLQFYMFMAKERSCYLSVIFGNSKYESCCVSFDKAYWHRMFDCIKEFNSYVQKDEEPIGFGEPIATEINHIPVDQMVVRNASTDNMFVDRAATYIKYQQHSVQFESAKKDLKRMIDDNEREVYCDQLQLKRSKNGSVRINIRNQV